MSTTAATGPVTAEGKAISSRNSLSHGLTAKQPILPGESTEEYREFVDSFIQTFASFNYLEPAKQSALATELADIRWRTRRVPAFEAYVLAYEIHTLTNNPDHASLIEGLNNEQIQGLAYIRLIERKVLQNLYAQEARLERRAEKLFGRLVVGVPVPSFPATAPVPQNQNRKNEPTLEEVIPLPAAAARKPAPVHSFKVGRNEPCPCGSQLKYKRCCGNPLGATPATAV